MIRCQCEEHEGETGDGRCNNAAVDLGRDVVSPTLCTDCKEECR